MNRQSGNENLVLAFLQITGASETAPKMEARAEFFGNAYDTSSTPLPR